MKKRSGILYALSFAIILPTTLVSCSHDSPDGSKGGEDNSKVITRFEPIPFTAKERAAIDATQPFSLDLFKKYSELTKSENIIISPLSVVIDLGMLANGVTDETQAEILEALGWTASGLENMNSYARRLMAEYPNMDRTTDVLIATGIFNQKDLISLKKEYTDKMKSVFNADAQSIDGDNWEQEISKWISDRSGGLIKDMNLGYKDALVSLLNVLYFKGFWKDKFDRGKTISGTFICFDGLMSDVDYLCDKRNVYAYQNENFSCVSLLFGNGAYSIDFMLPDEERGLDECLEDIDWEMWNTLRDNGESLRINLRIPKFEFSLVSDFKEALEGMGIRRIFSTNAQLGNMLKNKYGEITVSSVKQGCSFSVDEEDVTASATTAVNLGDTAPPPLEDGGDFFLDHPFVFAIRENSSGAILFMGKIGKL